MLFLKNLISKLFILIATLFVIATSTFFMVRALPGSPFSQDRVLPPEIMKNMEAKYGLDKPLYEQYFSYMEGISRGDLGPSLKYPNRNVQDILFKALPVSLTLGGIAILIAIALGIVFGILAALYPNKLIGIIPSMLATLFMSTPSFVFAAILIAVFGLKLGWFPVALWEGPAYMVLPAMTLAIAPTAYITRITRSAMLETLSQDYIKIALAKGVSYWDIVFKHAFRNSLLPIITVIGPLIAIVITGSFVVEFVFALPGMGKYFVSAFINRDYFLVSGVVLMFATILLFINTLTDLLFPYLNPKLRS